MPAIAVSKGVRISPRKVGEVAALVRGRSVQEALVILAHTPRRAASEVRDAVKSAAANAEHNHSFKPKTLQITEISVVPGVRLKRRRTAYRGTSRPFARKTSRIRVVVDGQKREIKKKVEAAATPAVKETA